MRLTLPRKCSRDRTSLFLTETRIATSGLDCVRSLLPPTCDTLEISGDQPPLVVQRAVSILRAAATIIGGQSRINGTNMVTSSSIARPTTQLCKEGVRAKRTPSWAQNWFSSWTRKPAQWQRCALAEAVLGRASGTKLARTGRHGTSTLCGCSTQPAQRRFGSQGRQCIDRPGMNVEAGAQSGGGQAVTSLLKTGLVSAARK